ncbi:hypothetical protein EVAR_25690_1 [Eumeta japonica]|uniref:Uncharacterized protein n=1 Tax=Eumeta variegata TaxID=151549 RepID=A0A4C1WDK4_EUMVA|nr:hypothetical protein EVAR_25690_1 [Eumeta japonica]
MTIACAHCGDAAPWTEFRLLICKLQIGVRQASNDEDVPANTYVGNAILSQSEEFDRTWKLVQAGRRLSTTGRDREFTSSSRIRQWYSLITRLRLCKRKTNFILMSAAVYQGRLSSTSLYGLSDAPDVSLSRAENYGRRKYRRRLTADGRAVSGYGARKANTTAISDDAISQHKDGIGGACRIGRGRHLNRTDDVDRFISADVCSDFIVVVSWYRGESMWCLCFRLFPFRVPCSNFVKLC